jgi:hypothetical protein
MFLYDRFSITGGGINGYFSVYGDIEKKDTILSIPLSQINVLMYLDKRDVYLDKVESINLRWREYHICIHILSI